MSRSVELRQRYSSPTIEQRTQAINDGSTMWRSKELVPQTSLRAEKRRTDLVRDQNIRVEDIHTNSFLHGLGMQTMQKKVEDKGTRKRSSELMKITLQLLNANLKKMSIGEDDSKEEEEMDVDEESNLGVQVGDFGLADQTELALPLYKIGDLGSNPNVRKSDNIILHSDHTTNAAVAQHLVTKAEKGSKVLILYAGSMNDVADVKDDLQRMFESSQVPATHLDDIRKFGNISERALRKANILWGEIGQVHDYFDMRLIGPVKTYENHEDEGEPSLTCVDRIDFVLWINVDECGSRPTDLQSAGKIARSLGMMNSVQQTIYIIGEQSEKPTLLISEMHGTEESKTLQMNLDQSQAHAMTPRSNFTDASRTSRCSIRSLQSDRSITRIKRQKTYVSAIKDQRIKERVASYAPLQLVQHAAYFVWIGKGSFVLGRCEGITQNGSGLFSYLEPPSEHGGALIRNLVRLGCNSWRVRSVKLSPQWLVDGYMRSYLQERDLKDLGRSGPKTCASTRLLEVFLMSRMMDNSPHNPFRAFRVVNGKKTFLTYSFFKRSENRHVTAWKMKWKALREEFIRIYPSAYRSLEKIQIRLYKDQYDEDIDKETLESKIEESFRQKGRMLRNTSLGVFNVTDYQDAFQTPVDYTYDGLNFIS